MPDSPCKLSQELLITLTSISPYDTTQCSVGFKRGHINFNRLALQQSAFGYLLQNPSEYRSMGFQIDQAWCSQNGRMIWRSLRQFHSQKTAQCQRISITPVNTMLGIQTVRIADQQQPEVDTGNQTMPPIFGA